MVGIAEDASASKSGLWITHISKALAQERLLMFWEVKCARLALAAEAIAVRRGPQLQLASNDNDHTVFDMF